LRTDFVIYGLLPFVDMVIYNPLSGLL